MNVSPVTSSLNNLWCLGSEGWSLLGLDSLGLYFVCWNGATSNGSFIQSLTDHTIESYGITFKNDSSEGG